MEIENLTWVIKKDGKKVRVNLIDLEQSHLVKIKQFVAKSPKWKDPIKSIYVQTTQQIIDYKDKKDRAFDDWFYNIVKPFEKNSLKSDSAFLKSYFQERIQKQQKFKK